MFQYLHAVRQPLYHPRAGHPVCVSVFTRSATATLPSASRASCLCFSIYTQCDSHSTIREQGILFVFQYLHAVRQPLYHPRAGHPVCVSVFTRSVTATLPSASRASCLCFSIYTQCDSHSTIREQGILFVFQYLHAVRQSLYHPRAGHPVSVSVFTRSATATLPSASRASCLCFSIYTQCDSHSTIREQGILFVFQYLHAVRQPLYHPRAGHPVCVSVFTRSATATLPSASRASCLCFSIYTQCDSHSTIREQGILFVFQYLHAV